MTTPIDIKKIFYKILCVVFWHKFYVIKEYGPEVRKVGCRWCYRQWGMHDGVRAFVPWDGELERLHECK